MNTGKVKNRTYLSFMLVHTEQAYFYIINTVESRHLELGYPELNPFSHGHTLQSLTICLLKPLTSPTIFRFLNRSSK